MNESAFFYAKECFSEIGVDVETAIKNAGQVSISLHCWQGDDVSGFESPDAALGDGLAVTGNYPGKARTLEELRQDLEFAFSLIPGRHRLNLHAIYGDFGSSPVSRDALEIKHYQSWVDWCQSQGLGMDFNPTCFAHPRAADGFTLSHQDQAVREFWIEHCRRCREIAAEIGRQLGSPSVNNIWIPDGFKDLPVDRLAPRERLRTSLDQILASKFESTQVLDAVESKLFGIGSESYVVGSHEFYLGYAIQKQILLCLDAGHFHPTESLADKISAVLPFVPGLLLHVSRGVRWDSDHVVLLDDPTKAIMEEVVRSGALDKVHIGLDFFDASINRLAAWVIGTRATQKALLTAFLEPRILLREAEAKGDYTKRLALLERLKTMPFGIVWEAFCERHNVPGEGEWLKEVQAYEKSALATRI